MANPTINWGTKVISVPLSFLTFVSGTNYSLDTNAFHIALKDLEDDEQGVVFPQTHRHNTVVTLGGIQYARIIEMINGYTVTFENGAYSVSLLGSNNNILDVTNLNQVSLRANNSAGLINVAEVQAMVFENGVTVDMVNGYAGTLYPAGSPLRPVNNFADAKSIATSRGFRTLYIVGNATMGATADFNSFTIRGQSTNLTALTIDPGANVANCEIKECSVLGTLDGGSILRECTLSTLAYVNGIIVNCMINTGTITLGGGSGTTLNMLECFSGVPGASAPVIDCGGDGAALGIRGYPGGITITNKSGAASVSIDLNSGAVTLASSVTAGTLVIRGVGSLTNQSVGATVVSTELLSPTSVAAATWLNATRTLTSAGAGGATAQEVWEYATRTLTAAAPSDARLILIEKILRNKLITNPATGKQVLYDDDGTTILLQGDLFQDAPGTTPYQGQGAERRERLA